MQDQIADHVETLARQAGTRAAARLLQTCDTDDAIERAEAVESSTYVRVKARLTESLGKTATIPCGIAAVFARLIEPVNASTPAPVLTVFK